MTDTRAWFIGTSAYTATTHSMGQPTQTNKTVHAIHGAYTPQILLATTQAHGEIMHSILCTHTDFVDGLKHVCIRCGLSLMYDDKAANDSLANVLSKGVSDLA